MSGRTPDGSPRDLSRYSRGDYSPGRGRITRGAWYVTSLILFESGWFPWYGLKRVILRCFGARIGCGVVIKPHVRIKYPWRLHVGNFSWIGQSVWIDNVGDVTIGSNVCVSQGVYLCTGSHDHQSATFDLITRPIEIADGAWIAARATLLPGVRVGKQVKIAPASVVSASAGSGIAAASRVARRIGPEDVDQTQQPAF
jgi:putative colanic acid biosynthesis acetyltransferase WcaF